MPIGVGPAQPVDGALKSLDIVGWSRLGSLIFTEKTGL